MNDERESVCCSQRMIRSFSFERARGYRVSSCGRACVSCCVAEAVKGRFSERSELLGGHLSRSWPSDSLRTGMCEGRKFFAQTCLRAKGRFDAVNDGEVVSPRNDQSATSGLATSTDIDARLRLTVEGISGCRNGCFSRSNRESSLGDFDLMVTANPSSQAIKNRKGDRDIRGTVSGYRCGKKTPQPIESKPAEASRAS